MELIDRKALKNALIPLWNCRSDSEFANKDVWREIENAPTIDAVPVVHGKWERELDVYDEPFYQCSVCGECFDSNRDSTHEVFKYCPDCGARMDMDYREPPQEDA